MTIAALLLFAMFQEQALPIQPGSPDPNNVLQSFYAVKDWEPAADPAAAEWAGIPGVTATKDYFAKPVKLPETVIRSRWTRRYLYLLFTCPYNKLTLKNSDPVTDSETDNLWKWDVAEAFIGSDYLNTARYKEFQVSPRGEFVDLDIDRSDPKNQKGVEWDSGFTVSGRIDSEKKIWYGEMRIPFQSLDVKQPKVGDELRIGLYRIAGQEPNRMYLAWRPTGASTFHVPDAFGSLVLEKAPPEKAASEKAGPEKPAVEKAPADKPAADKPAADKPTADKADKEEKK
jgi:hypothetical protein